MAQTENAMLILQAGGNEAGRRWPLGRKRIVIGRDIDCDIVLPDRLVSRHHAQIVWDPERPGYLLQDLYSKNGTFVNGLELAEPSRVAGWRRGADCLALQAGLCGCRRDRTVDV